MLNNAEEIFKNLKKLGEDLGFPESFISQNLDKARVLIKEKEAQKKAESIEKKASVDELDISNVLKNALENEDLGRFFEGMVRKSSYQAPVTITEDENYYNYFIDLPGIKSKEDISIDIQNKMLVISAKRELPENLINSTAFYGDIKIELNEPESYKEIIASFENGVLNIVFEKKPEISKKVNII